MSVYSGDFLGFRLGNIHSSQLNITRVSNNDRYTENLTSTFKDQVTELPGRDGVYYWNTYYTQQNFIIDFAFDDLRAEDIRRLRAVFNFKGVQELVFDETPYKKYMVKCSNPPTLKYIAFDVNDITIYKGEGTLNLVAFYPYALSVDEINISQSSNSGEVIQELPNSGDLETPFKIYFPVSAGNITMSMSNGDIHKTIKLENIVKQYKNDSYICIDMKTNLIEGVDSNFQKTGHLYNQFKTSGDFFSLPVGRNTLETSIPFKKINYYYIYY